MGIDITINLQSLGSSTYLAKLQNSELACIMFDYTPSYADPNDPVQALFLSDGKFASILHYNNSYVDQLINQGIITPNQTLRNSIYHQIEVNASGDYPFIYIAQLLSVVSVNSQISGVNDTTTNSMNPMLYGPNIQYLSKNYTAIISGPSSTGLGSTSFATSSFSQPSSSNANILSLNMLWNGVIFFMSFLIVISLAIFVFFAIYSYF